MKILRKRVSILEAQNSELLLLTSDKIKGELQEERNESENYRVKLVLLERENSTLFDELKFARNESTEMKKELIGSNDKLREIKEMQLNNLSVVKNEIKSENKNEIEDENESRKELIEKISRNLKLMKIDFENEDKDESEDRKDLDEKAEELALKIKFDDELRFQKEENSTLKNELLSVRRTLRETIVINTESRNIIGSKDERLIESKRKEDLLIEEKEKLILKKWASRATSGPYRTAVRPLSPKCARS